MHAEQIVIPAHGCHPLPDNVSWQAGVLVSGDGLGVPFDFPIFKFPTPVFIMS